MGSPLGIPGLREPEEIGRGGFGTVYRAEEPEFGHKVAVKIIQDRLNDDEVRRAFIRECQDMGRLSGHPNIVTVHRGGTTELGQPYIVMDLMSAGSLADRLQATGPLPWSEVLEIGVALAGALETAHRARILHLDVKPANVLMSRFGEPKLADFGISRLPGVTATTDGRIRASIAYAAPERLLDGTATPAADLYALGGTLYTLLVGQPAFATRPGEDLLAAIARIVRQPVPELRGRGVPDEVAHVVERLMAKSPLDRFASASNAVFALQAAQRATGRPVTRAVIEGAAPERGDTRTWAMRPPAVEPDERDPELTRPRYVPRQRSNGSGSNGTTDGVPAEVLPPGGRPYRGPEPTLRYPLDRPSPNHPPPGEVPGPRSPAGPPTAGPPAGVPRTRTLVGTPALEPSRGDAPAPDPSRGDAPPGRGTGRPHRRGPIVAATAATVVLAVGGGGALLLNRLTADPTAGGTGPTVTSTPVPASTPPVSTPTPRQLAVANSVRHPERTRVAARLEGYFAAINDRRYEQAFEYFSAESAVARNGFAAFEQGYSTTAIQRGRIVAIKDLAQGAVEARVTYRSIQSAEFGPNGETCTDWHLAYELTGPDGLIQRARLVEQPAAC